MRATGTWLDADQVERQPPAYIEAEQGFGAQRRGCFMPAAHALATGERQ
jgi:hypothetical protein